VPARILGIASGHVSAEVRINSSPSWLSTRLWDDSDVAFPACGWQSWTKRRDLLGPSVAYDLLTRLSMRTMALLAAVVGIGCGSSLSPASGTGGSGRDDSAVSSSGGDGSGGGSTDGSSTFTPAAMPADIYAMLTVADLQMLLPTAGSGVEQDPLTGPPFWELGCQWNGPEGEVQLSLAGALTAEGNAALDVDVSYIFPDGSTSSMPVRGVGSNAEYVNYSGKSQSLRAKLGPYLVTVDADGFTPDVPEAKLQPLVTKVLNDL